MPPAALSGGWSVNLSGTWGSSTTPTISFTEPNGTYPWALGIVPGDSPDVRQGSLVVHGNSTDVKISWNPTTYSVTFVESGLYHSTTGGATNWTLYVTGQAPITIGYGDPPYSEGFVNGTYTFTATASVPGIALVPPLQSYTVNGGPVTVNVTFLWVYSVAFVESGLPQGTAWGVLLGGSLIDSMNSTVQFAEPNGTYDYTVSNVSGFLLAQRSGSVSVSGHSVVVNVTFTPPTWNVTFTETGLPSGTSWNVTVNGTQKSSSGPTIVFAEPNGTYPFSVTPLPNYTVAPQSGPVTMDGAPVNVPVVFTYSPTNQTVTFTETGLPTGMTWSVTLGGTAHFSQGSPLTFSVPNGRYPYTVGPIAGYQAQPPNGSVVVDGAPVGVTIVFALFHAHYLVTFFESGLPNGTAWSVTVAGTLWSSTGLPIIFPEPNGTYRFTVTPIPAYLADPPSGNLTVDGSALVEEITFTPFSAEFVVTFVAQGLPTGTPWSVVLAGTPGSSNTSTIAFAEPNGTYPYALGSVPGWTTANFTGSLVVQGRMPPLNVRWSLKLYSVTFGETGLPADTLWSVTLNGTQRSSTGTSIAFQEPNGTYEFTVQPPPGYGAVGPSTGSVAVTAAPAQQTIAFAARGTGWTDFPHPHQRAADGARLRGRAGRRGGGPLDAKPKGIPAASSTPAGGPVRPGVPPTHRRVPLPRCSLRVT